MAVVTLISPYEDITSLGIRHIGAYAKRHQHQVRYLFLPWTHKETDGALPYAPDIHAFYASETLEKVLEICKGSDLVGVSLMTPYLPQAVEITHSVHEKLGLPVVWGGIHPTI